MRAIGAWPFVSLFTGAVLALGWTHRRWMAPLLTGVAVAYTVYYLPAYFHAYDKVEQHWFMREMTDVLAKESHENPAKTAARLTEISPTMSSLDIPQTCHSISEKRAM